MDEVFRAAVVQMTSGPDKAANLAVAVRQVEAAAARGAALVVLPELFNCLGPLEHVVQQAEPIPGPTSTAMSRLARRLGIVLCAGSMCEQSGEPSRGYNTALLFGRDGRELGRYRKLHLFDVDLPGKVSYEESRWLRAGDSVVSIPTDLAHLGLAICYDLRFPELFRCCADSGAEVLLVPSAFSAPTGRDHWDVLIRARAIENQAFVLASNQCGQHTPSFSTWGHSAILDPWGDPLASLGDSEGIAVATIDPGRLAEVRRSLPALSHRKIGRG